MELWVCVLQQRECRHALIINEERLVSDGNWDTWIMYGVLYAISPEIFPAKDRGTGNGLTATATRLFAIVVRKRRSCTPQILALFHSLGSPMTDPTPILTIPSSHFQSPIIALYADLTTAVPVYVSGALILLAGALTLALPFEPRGKASL